MSRDQEGVPIIVSAVEIINGREAPIGEPRQRTISRGAMNLITSQAALEDRQQRAREAFYDAMAVGDVIESRAVESAIETATRVKLTPEIIEAAGAMRYAPGAPTATAVLEAAGFEVEQ